MWRSWTRSVAVLAIVLMGFAQPLGADEECEQTDLKIVNLALIENGFNFWISNPTNETLWGELWLDLVWEETDYEPFAWQFAVPPLSTVIVEVRFPTSNWELEWGDEEDGTMLCGCGPSCPPAVNEAPDPILVRVK